MEENINYEELVKELSTLQSELNKYGNANKTICELTKGYPEKQDLVKMFKFLLNYTTNEVTILFENYLELHTKQCNLSQTRERVKEIRKILKI